MIRKQTDASMGMLTHAARDIGIENCNYQVTCMVADRNEFIRHVTSMISGVWTVVFILFETRAPSKAFVYCCDFEDALAVDLAFS